MRLRLLTGVLALGAASFAAAATLDSAVGPVSVRLSAGGPFVTARAGMTLPAGATVRTGVTGRALLRFSETDLVRLAPGSELNLSLLPGGANHATILSLAIGRVRAMLRRAVRSRTPDFAIASGSAVAAVKGTDFELELPAIGGEVTLRVDAGSVAVAPLAGRGLADVVSAFNGIAAGRLGTSIAAGFEVEIRPGGRIGTAAPAPARTTLEVLGATGRVTVATANGTKTVEPGEEIPAGSKVSVDGGTVILASPQAAVTAGDGSVLAISVGAQGQVTVAPVSGPPVLVDTGGSTRTLEAGQQATVTSGGAVAVTSVPVAGNGTTPGAGTTPPPPAGQETLTAQAPAGGSNIFTLVLEPYSSSNSFSAPPPPPDTVNQDVIVVSPSSPQ